MLHLVRCDAKAKHVGGFLPTGAHADAGDAEATKAPFKKCSLF
ncbi:hypothetical protein [Rhizobium leguminosarum]|nr:hypothetical protein [Rhizobium leguminosarum]